MKKIAVTLFIFFSFSFCKAQWVTLTDHGFVMYLNELHPECMDGYRMDTTCYGIVNDTFLVPKIIVDTIRDLTGIQYFDHLQDLRLGDIHIDTLPRLPRSLKTLFISYCYINGFHSLPDSITTFTCINNPMTNLPSHLPVSLTSLTCYSNRLTTLPELPAYLTTILCHSNQITSLPNLPSSLTFLDCAFNQLRYLPALPNSLVKLKCWGNRLNSLPVLPSKLQYLDCSNDSISTLPDLPASLDTLSCSHNQLTSLPILPDSIREFICVYNFGIKCFPPMQNFYGTSFNLSYTSVSCLPNKINHPNAVSLPDIDNLPVCGTTFNPNQCPITDHCYAHFTLHPDAVTLHHWFALDESIGKSPISYSWTWGDGGVSTSGNASHTYSSPGIYKICLTITDDTTCTFTYCDSSTYISRMEEDNAIISVDVVSSLPTESHTVSTSDSNIRIYPNPVKELLVVGCSLLGNKQIEIQDLLGRTLQIKSINEQRATYNFSIDVSELSQGIYFIHFHSANGDTVRKFVKE